MSDHIIEDGQIVGLQYTLHNDKGDDLGNSAEDGPLEYLHGAQHFIPGLEKALTGAKLGDELEVVVQAEEGFGPRNEEGVQKVERKQFPEDLDLQVGMQFAVENEANQLMPVWVVGVDDDEVTIDFNHPLAGQELHFKVTVAALREATEEEKNHGHPHAGEDGCGCGHEH